MHAHSQKCPCILYPTPEHSHAPAHVHWQSIPGGKWFWLLLWHARHGFFKHSLRDVGTATTCLDLYHLIEGVLVVRIVPCELSLCAVGS